MVYPSAGACTVASTAGAKSPPGLLSVRKVQPTRSLSLSPIRRDSRSPAAPGVSGMTERIGRDGKSCADAVPANQTIAAPTDVSTHLAKFPFMIPLLFMSSWPRLLRLELDFLDHPSPALEIGIQPLLEWLGGFHGGQRIEPDRSHPGAHFRRVANRQYLA